MNNKVNWGIIGLGKIAHKFAQDLQLVEGSNVYAVASRNQAKATDFGLEYKADKSYGNYQELLDDPAVDVVYIATPHVHHCDLTLKALDAGKAVLCEKAFGMDASEVIRMIAKAKEKQLFLMEALWTRFIPATEKMMQLLESGLIGNLINVRADFGFKAEFDPEKRLFNKKLGGGSLLDIGIYPVFLSLLTMGVPKEIRANAIMTTTDVDGACAMFFTYNNGSSAVLDSNLMASTPLEGWLHGDKGSLKLHNRFHHTREISHFIDNKLIETYETDYVGNGYYHEILEVQECLNNGKLESDKMPLSFSLELIQLLDAIREKINLHY